MKRFIAAVAALVTVLGVLMLSFRDRRTSPAAASAVSAVANAEPTAADLCRMTEPVQGSTPVSPPAPTAEPTPVTPVVFSPVSAGLPQRRTPPRTVPDVVVTSASAPPVVPPDLGEEAMEKVQTMLRDYRTRMGENPVGSNAEIMRAVMGGNPAQAHLGPPPGLFLNESGELMDPWGTPLFFHQESAKSMEVRSAGPDRKLWTTDDLLSH
jgi:hypothetical protein